MQKQLLYALIVASLIPMIVFPLIFISTGFFEPQDTFWVFGSWTGLIGFMLLFWEYVIGIRSIAYYFTQNVASLINLHKWLGINGFILLCLHPLLLMVEYILHRSSILLTLNIADKTDLRIVVGEIAFVLVFGIWLSSHWMRKSLSYRWWKRFHLLSYAIIPFVYIHADDIGTFLQNHWLDLYFKFLLVVFGLLLFYRILKQLGTFKYKYSVVSVDRITYDTVRVNLAPVEKDMMPQLGQFIDIQTEIFGESHPFTVAFFNSQSKELSIVTKASGWFSKSLANLQQGQIVYLDGPYGVFTREAYKAKKLVLIAGGIGITPFISLVNYIKSNSNQYQEAILFYGNKSEADIAFKDDLASSGNYKAVHVLSNEQNPNYETGFVNVDLIKKYLKDNLVNYDFFICGPPVMMDKISTALMSQQVPQKQIYMERFDF